jgi:hypothetical protein
VMMQARTPVNSGRQGIKGRDVSKQFPGRLRSGLTCRLGQRSSVILNVASGESQSSQMFLKWVEVRLFTRQ